MTETNEPAMIGTDEHGDEVAKVIDRLATRFPTLERDHIADIVEEEHDRLNGARVRDFIPVLVEHAATDRLREEATPLLPSAEDAADGVGNFATNSSDPMEVERRRQQPGGPLLGNAGGS
jgi:hypothetical protein